MYTIDLRTDAHRPANARRRVAKVLGLLADAEGPSLNYTGSQLATMADTQRDHTSRAISEFRRRGIIERRGSVLTILDRDALDAEVTR